MTRPAPHLAVNVAPPSPRPRLALLLALLSVPGSTLAWDLPMGGFWIGLPLALAAIALGVTAWRAAGRTPMVVAAVTIAGLMVAMTVAWTVAGLLT